jgi:glycosyltransferase involved in cell wall biosynthesis
MDVRIVLVAFSPSGGLFQFAFQLGEALARRGHDVRLVTGARPELSSRQRGFSVLGMLRTWHPQASTVEPPALRKARRTWRGVQYTFAWLQLLAALGRLRPDVVLFSEWRFPLDGAGVWLARRRLPHARLGMIAHEPRSLGEQRGQGLYRDGRVLTAALGAAWRRMDVCFALGEEARSEIIETWAPSAHVVVIPHGDEGIFLGDAITPVGETDPVILFFGTLTQYKGLDVLLDAFQLVRAEMASARLIIAGGVGADLDLAALRRRADGIPGTSLRPGYVPTPEVAGLVNAARVLAVPYLRASQSGVVHLAHTFHRPVVASRVGDIPAAVREGEDGWLVPPGDPGQLARALLVPLRDAGIAAAYGENAAERLRQGASWDAVVERMSPAFERCHQAAPAVS